MKASEWAFDRIKETFEQAAQDEARKMSIVQEIMIRNTDYLRRIIAPAEGARRRYDVTLVPALQQFPYIWRVSGGKKHTTWLCAWCAKYG